MVFSVPAQQVGEGTSGHLEKGGQALLRPDKTSRAGDTGPEKKRCWCVSLFMRLIQNVFFNFGGAGNERKKTGEL